MIVEELGVTFPGSINLDGSVQFADILKDGMGFPAISNIPVFGLYQCINQIVAAHHDASSMAWRRGLFRSFQPPRPRSRRERICEELTGAPDTLVDFHTGRGA